MELTEKWMPIEDYENLYEVSSFGKVRSIDRITSCLSKGGVFVNKIQRGKELKWAYWGNNYRFVTLSKNGITKGFSIHRLVAIAFIPNPNNLPEVNHIFGNKDDNSDKSLEWCSKKHNTEHAIKNNLIDNKGSKNPYAKKVTIRLGDFIKVFNTQREAALFLGVKDVNISSARANKTKCKKHEIF